MNKILAIIGSGHLGEQIAHYAISDSHYDEVVFFDDFSKEEDNCKQKIIGKIKDVEKAFQNNEFNELLIGIGYKHLNFRKELFERFYNVIPFGIIIHSSCWVDKTAEINDGVVLYPHCCIESNSIIDKNSILNINCSIAHDSYIGKHCFLSPRVTIAGFVEVEEQCIIGINATIIDNVKIVPKTQIGAGAVIIRNIETKGIYAGNPGKFLK